MHLHDRAGTLASVLYACLSMLGNIAEMMGLIA